MILINKSKTTKNYSIGSLIFATFCLLLLVIVLTAHVKLNYCHVQLSKDNKELIHKIDSLTNIIKEYEDVNNLSEN